MQKKNENRARVLRSRPSKNSDKITYVFEFLYLRYFLMRSYGGDKNCHENFYLESWLEYNWRNWLQSAYDCRSLQRHRVSRLFTRIWSRFRPSESYRKNCSYACLSIWSGFNLLNDFIFVKNIITISSNNDILGHVEAAVRLLDEGAGLEAGEGKKFL